jgi:hypothetical protein
MVPPTFKTGSPLELQVDVVFLQVAQVVAGAVEGRAGAVLVPVAQGRRLAFQAQHELSQRPVLPVTQAQGLDDGKVVRNRPKPVRQVARRPAGTGARRGRPTHRKRK